MLRLPSFRIACAAVLVPFLAFTTASALIKANLPVEALLKESTFIVMTKVEKLLPDKPAMVLAVQETLKGKSPFKSLPRSLRTD